MHSERRPFGFTASGRAAELFTLANNSGARIKITNYGGIITDIHVPDKHGDLTNVVLGFDTLEDYQSEIYKKSMPYFGAIIGRYGNRINKGNFTIDGQEYHVPCNLGEVSLHGGIEGFDKKIWTSALEQDEASVSVRLSYLSRDMEEGFPGNLNTTVTYTWNNHNELSITYLAETDKPTHFNPTNHTYFNLNGCKRDVLDHEVMIVADGYTEVDDLAVPTGRILAVDAERMDFRTPRKIGGRIGKVQGTGYDHNYVIKGADGSLRLVAAAKDRESGISMQVLSTEPAVQFYTANHLDGSLTRKQAAFSKHMGFCFETQHYPDSPNQPAFPSTLLRPGKVFTSKTIYRFPEPI